MNQSNLKINVLLDRRRLKSLAIALITYGILSFSFGLINTVIAIVRLRRFVIYDSWAYISSGVWSGALLIISGSIGVNSAFTPQEPRKTLATVGLVFTIISSIACLNMIWIESLGAKLESNYLSISNSFTTSIWNPDLIYIRLVFGIHCALAVFALTAAITGFIYSAYCYKYLAAQKFIVENFQRPANLMPREVPNGKYINPDIQPSPTHPAEVYQPQSISNPTYANYQE